MAGASVVGASSVGTPSDPPPSTRLIGGSDGGAAWISILWLAVKKNGWRRRDDHGRARGERAGLERRAGK
jgi:hypothetical protein